MSCFARHFVLFAFFLHAASTGVRAQVENATTRPPSEEELWQAVEEHPREEIDRLIGPQGEFTKRRSEIQNQISGLEEMIHAREHELEELREKIARRIALVSRVSTSRLFGISGYVAFVVLIVHLLVFLYRTPEPPLPFRQALFAAIGILILFSLPAFGGETLDESLADVNLLLKATPAEKVLYWVEHLEGSGKLPVEVRVRDGDLVPHRDLEKGSAEYHFTRAALLFETGSRDGAIEALKKVPTARVQTEPADDLYSRALQFLARERAEPLQEIARALLPRIGDTGALVRIAAALNAAGHEKLSDAATERILERSGSASELVVLTDQAYDLGDSRTASRLAPAALERIRSSGEGLALGRVLLKAQRDVPLARKALAQAISKAGNLKDIGDVIEFCLGAQEFSLAARASEAAIERFGKSVAEFSIPDPRLIYTGEILSGENRVSLAVLLGILNEKLELPAGAKPAYEHAAAQEVDRILSVAAFDLPADLRSLFYIERFWRNQDEEEHLRLLRPLYQRLQDGALEPILQKIRLEEEEKLKRLEAEIGPLEKKRAILGTEVDAARAVLSPANRGLWLWIAHIAGVVAAIVLITFGCFRHARDRSKGLDVSRSRSFLGLYTEALGWVLVFSVVGAWLGVIQVLGARLFLLSAAESSG